MGKGGHSAPGEELHRPEELLAQPRFQPFQQPEFNVSEFTSRILAGSKTTAQAQVDELRASVRQLDGALSTYVFQQHHDLLQHAHKLADTEHAVQDVMLSMGSLQASVKRVRAEIEGPYKQIQTKTQQLRNLHDTVELLRQLIHRLKLVAKLRQQMAVPAASLDLAKAAKLLADISAISREGDLSGLAAAAADDEFLRSTAAAVHDQAQVALLEGMESLNQAKVGSALQVFYNLEELPQAVEALSKQHLSELERGLRQALDSRALSLASAAASAAASSSSSSSGPGSGPGAARGLTAPAPGGTAGWQDKLWGGLRGVLDQAVTGCLAVWHLQRVVAKKKDPLSHVLFLDVLCPPGEPLLTEQFWQGVLGALSDAFASAAKPAKGAFVREALSAGYPKLVGLLEAAFSRLQADTQVKGVAPFVGPDQLPAFVAVAAPFRDAYLAGCLGRLQDGINTTFAGGARGLPTTAEVQKCIVQLHEELKAAGASAQLGLQIGAVVRKAVHMLAERVEYMAAAGPELRQVPLGPAAGGGATPGQLRNIALCSQLQEVHRSLAALLPRLSPPAASALQASLGVVQSTAVEMVAPMFRAAVESMEGSIGAMHQQQWGPPAAAATGPGGEGSAEAQAAAAAAVVEASGYCNTLANSIAQFRAEYLSKFVPQPSPSVPSCISSLCQRTAARLLSFWLRHAALLRPLGQQGKLQLARDLGELQLLVSQGVYPLEALGPVHKAVRAFRALLFTEDAALADSKATRDLPATLVLLHLFSRLPGEAAAPHERSGLTPVQYSKWLDAHSAAETLKSIAAALKQAEAVAAGWSEPQRAVFAHMQQLCKATLEATAASAGGGV